MLLATWFHVVAAIIAALATAVALYSCTLSNSFFFFIIIFGLSSVAVFNGKNKIKVNCCIFFVFFLLGRRVLEFNVFFSSLFKYCGRLLYAKTPKCVWLPENYVLLLDSWYIIVYYYVFCNKIQIDESSQIFPFHVIVFFFFTFS